MIDADVLETGADVINMFVVFVVDDEAVVYACSNTTGGLGQCHGRRASGF